MALNINVVYKTEGEYIPVALTNKGVIKFGDEDLTIKLPKYERDDAVDLDICHDWRGNLIMGMGVRYVAQIHIPERQYTEVEKTEIDEITGEERTVLVPEPVPFDVNRCTLYLWALDKDAPVENDEEE